MERCHLTAILVLLLAPSLHGSTQHQSRSDLIQHQSRSDLIQHQSRSDLMDKCKLPMPIYLKRPHSYVAYIPLDESHEAIFRSAQPRIDNQWYRSKWRAEDQPSADGNVVWVEQQGQMDRRVEKEHPMTWNRKPKEMKAITYKQIAAVFLAGEAKHQKTKNLNKLMDQKNIKLSHSSPAYLLSSFNLPQNIKTIENISNQGYVEGLGTELLMKTFQIQASSDLQLVGNHDLCEKISHIIAPPSCSHSYKYRTMNGTCNNMVNPLWGSALTAFRRLMPPDYGDNVFMLRQDSSGKPLPSARLVSTSLNIKKNRWSSCFTVLHMTFGQFIDHDITSSPIATGVNGSTIPCCTPEVQNEPDLFHPECAPITIPPLDPLYGAYGHTCMELVRTVPSYTCTLGPREQLNQITSYIDGSTVYDNSVEFARSLRSLEDGLLHMQVTKEGYELLPGLKNPGEECNKDEIDKDHLCFHTGDHRVNEQILLTLTHTIFARLHNLVARELKLINPHWNDEKLFQEARKVVGAIIQNIAYREFLQGVLGTAVMKALRLLPQEGGRHTADYDPTINAAISNEFAAAAYRFGHSMIPTHILEVSGNQTNALNLNQMLFSPFKLYSTDKLGKLARGSIRQKTGEIDFSFTDEIRGKLFQRGEKVGMDLIAINIQRGREHGLGSYAAARVACGLREAKTFKDLATSIDSEILKSLEQLYKKVEDIDLFVGGLCERPLAGSQVGPTFACIIGDQFLRLKRGDRHWFENKDSPSSFSKEQLRMIHKSSMARVLCDTVLEMSSVQRWPFNVESAYNPELSCSSPCIPTLDFSDWKE